MARSDVNNSAREDHAAIKREFNRMHGLDNSAALLSTAGTTSAYTLTFTTAPASLFTGLIVGFKVNATNAVDVTLNVNALGAAAIQKMTTSGYSNLAAGDLVTGQHAWCKYDATLAKWILLTPIAPSVSLAVANTWTAAQIISLATAGNNLTLTTTDAGAVGSTLRGYHNTASPANSDTPLVITSDGKDSGASDQIWAQLKSVIIDVTAASEDAVWSFLTAIAGTVAERWRIGAGLYATGLTDPGAGKVNASDYQKSGTALPLTTSFVSSAQTITAAGALTIAHGLSAEPAIVLGELQCTANDQGYLTDEHVPIGLASSGGLGGATHRGVSVKKDATNLTVRFGSDANTFAIPHATTGDQANLTNSKWKLVLKAYV